VKYKPTQIDHSVCLRLARDCVTDTCADVRAELIVALHWLVLDFEDNFVTLAFEQKQADVANKGGEKRGSLPHSISPPAPADQSTLQRIRSTIMGEASTNGPNPLRHTTSANVFNLFRQQTPAADVTGQKFLKQKKSI
jgi:hypothetical protein